MFDPLPLLDGYEELKKGLWTENAPVGVLGCMDPQKAELVSGLSAGQGWVLYICRDERTLTPAFNDLRNFEPNTYIYPAKDLLFYSSDIRGNYITNERIEALRHLVEDRRGVLVTTIDGLMDKIQPREEMEDRRLCLYESMVIYPSDLSALLTDMGYARVPQVEMQGEYSVRGGIFDIYPVTDDRPYRIEFFDKEIDTIRSFDLDTQRSLDRAAEIKIYQADEKKGKRTEVSLLDYFGEGSLIALDEPTRIRDRAKAVELEFSESMERRLEKGIAADEDMVNDIFSSDQIMGMLRERRSVLLSSLDESLGEFGAVSQARFRTASVGSYKESFEMFIGALRNYQEQGYRVSLLTPSRTRMSRLAENLREYGIHAYCPDIRGAQELRPGDTEVVYGDLSEGFAYPDIAYVLITESDMLGAVRKKKRKRREHAKGGIRIGGLDELSPGDYVVHESHGIGIYRGIEHIERDGAGKDYIKIEYADGGNLYLPATKLELVQKYSGSEGRKPKINRLGGTEWQKTKARVRHSVADIAKELIELYAKRFSETGFRYGEDTVWQKEFEELFPYDETEDQLHAIEAVKTDMESGRIMDRLVCGDVGYGKTEIALRAAFKAVQDGKQVAFLVPTTILAQQHYNTFMERMKPFPVNIEMMSRFRTPAENRKTAEKLKNGSLDIVIGTHRLLSKDVGFKDLGLLIIDEEQRFGVAHKEKIKQLRSNVDVLTLTATPIPRTLHMSLSGIRDLSVLEEPPMDRVPIQTYVMEYNDELVREAAEREIQRGGQVFYVYNKVKGIEEKTDHLRSLLPDINIGFAHGQMHEHELEKIMMQFITGELDMLVSTTIIETGLDIPNANTLIIEGAERMGLSQLYQIRGRVGRSDRTAYAFLMYKKDRILSEEAEKRLKTIREFTELGSGIKIAMRDLEIRGAGNVLGAEQHGQMEAVGYDLYCKLLRQAVRLLKGDEEKEPEFETTVDCDIDAYIPDSYIPDEYQKLDIYKRISDIHTEEDYMDMLDELTDRYGDPPKPVMNLLMVAKLKMAGHDAFATDISVRKTGYTIEMYPKADIRVEAVPDLITAERGRLKFIRGLKPKFAYEERNTVHSDAYHMLKKASELLTALRK